MYMDAISELSNLREIADEALRRRKIRDKLSASYRVIKDSLEEKKRGRSKSRYM